MLFWASAFILGFAVGFVVACLIDLSSELSR